MSGNDIEASIDFADYQLLVGSTVERRAHLPGIPWQETIAGYVLDEYDEFLHQHGDMQRVLVQDGNGFGEETAATRQLRQVVAEEAADLLWFGFFTAGRIGATGQEVSLASLERHTGKGEDVGSLDELQLAVVANAHRVNLSPGGEENIYSPTLATDPAYVLERSVYRLVAALREGEDAASKPDAIERAAGDLIISLAYISHVSLHWRLGDLAIANILKLYERSAWGKEPAKPGNLAGQPAVSY